MTSFTPAYDVSVEHETNHSPQRDVRDLSELYALQKKRFAHINGDSLL